MRMDAMPLRWSCRASPGASVKGGIASGRWPCRVPVRPGFQSCEFDGELLSSLIVYCVYKVCSLDSGKLPLVSQSPKPQTDSCLQLR